MVKKLAVIDGKSVFYRGYYAMPGLSLSDGTPTGGVYGFTSLAIELIKKLQPDYVAVAWDKKDTNIRKRRAIYPEYKAGRKKAPDDFYEQIPILHELLDAFGWPLYEMDDYEADDIMGSFARQATDKGIETCLLTSDLDALQLINPLTKVYALKNGLSRLEEFDVNYFKQKYGIKVDQFLDLKSLQGDSSDNLPGVPGIGIKTGVELLQKYHTLDNIFAHLSEIKPTIAKKLVSGKESAYMTKEVARIWSEAPVELNWDVADVNDTNLPRIAEILKRLEFDSLIRRLPKYMRSSDTDASLEQKTEITLLEETAWTGSLGSNQPVALMIKDDELWLSVDQTKVMHKKIADLDKKFWQQLQQNTIINFDIKALYHQLSQHNISLYFDLVHDLSQGAFLTAPLKRDQSLNGLAGYSADLSPKSELSAYWHLYDQQLSIFAQEPKIAEIAQKLDFPLTYILFLMEKTGVKIDTKFLAQISQQLDEEYRTIEQNIFKLVGYNFNIASPAQLSDALFTKLQLPTEGIKKSRRGYSTSQKELDKLHGQHPIIELIEKSRELAKLKNTYVDVLPKLVDDKSRLHTTFNQNIAITGRLSSTNPNLQNIPIRSKLGRQIRQGFIAEEGNLLVSADYSQFELRLAAVLADDQKMIDDFNKDIDIHTKTASEVYGVPLAKVTSKMRRNAKVINFGVLYGMSPHGLSAATGMSFGEARRFIDDYFEVRAPIRQFLNKTLENARTNGYVETFFGRRRPTPDVLSSNYMVRAGAERAATNMPIQGTEADLMKRAMIKINEQIIGLGKQILQIHDSVLVECPAKNASQISQILRDIMENIAPEMKIKLKVDIKVGKNWGEL